MHTPGPHTYPLHAHKKTPPTKRQQDYLVAEGGCDAARVYGAKVTYEPRVFFSQDGVKWADLPRLEPEAAARVGRIRAMLTGDPAFQYAVAEVGAGVTHLLCCDIHGLLAASQTHRGDRASFHASCLLVMPARQNPQQADPAEAGGEPAFPADGGDDGAGAGGRKFTVSEAQRLRGMVDAINALAAVQPKGCCVANAHNQLVANKLFSGLSHPDKLESYQHRTQALAPEASLAQDVRGSWAVRADLFKGVTTLRRCGGAWQLLRLHRKHRCTLDPCLDVRSVAETCMREPTTTATTNPTTA
jgi:hypothetical protein